MEQLHIIPAWRRRCARMLRVCCTVFVCLAGTVACLEDADDVAVDARPRRVLPTTTPRVAQPRDVRVTGAQGAQPSATPAPTPTFVPTDPRPSQAAQAAQPTQVAQAAQPTQAAQPARGRVVYTGEEGLNVRTQPGQQIIAALLQGSYVTIRGAARDEGGFRWWPVMVEPGWMAEGPSDPAQGRWLVPVDAEQLEPGRQARVEYPGKDGLNVRQTAGADGAISSTLLQGSLVTVVGGPEHVDGMAWWQVQVAEGWLSEGSTGTSESRWIVMEP